MTCSHTPPIVGLCTECVSVGYSIVVNLSALEFTQKAIMSQRESNKNAQQISPNTRRRMEIGFDCFN